MNENSSKNYLTRDIKLHASYGFCQLIIKKKRREIVLKITYLLPILSNKSYNRKSIDIFI